MWAAGASIDGVLLQRLWVTPLYNYDDVSSAMLSMFVIGTGNKWTDLMFASMDVNGEDNVPRMNTTEYFALFSVVFIVIVMWIWCELKNNKS